MLSCGAIIPQHSTEQTRYCDVCFRAPRPSEFRRTATQELAAKDKEWRFILPYVPHFGGEELSTLLCQVEACLNSRPLMPITEGAKDLLPLTPGHFLIGEPVTSLETSTNADFDVTGLKRWRLVNNLRNHFWRRWQHEYLHLQQRPKWRTRLENLQEGSLVLTRNELSPPTKWPLARVLKVHVVPDGWLPRYRRFRRARYGTGNVDHGIPRPRVLRRLNSI